MRADMRTGGHAVQQALGAEAAAAVRQATSLARRRGHAQVTPLHVASAMLNAPSGGLLRAACLRSHPDPLQHEALELCLDVALSRLPVAAWPWPSAGMSRHGRHGGGHHHHAPATAALSNALVAALKRAQAQQRRGAMDGPQGQRQPAAVPAAKVELEQLIVAILDDPGIDRAMREAGFSSSLVKANVDNRAAASLDQSRSASSDTASPNPIRKKARAGERPSLENFWEVLHRPVVVPERCLALSLSCHSGDQASQAKPRTGQLALVEDTEAVTATVSLPPWLRRCQDPILTRPTHCGIGRQATCHRTKFTELTAENLKILCIALERRVPRHKYIVPGIASTVLRCRSGMMRRARRSSTSSATWLLFRGKDGLGKMAMAQELAKVIFGSYTEFTLVNSGSISGGELTLKMKRSRDNDDNGYLGTRLFEAILENPHRVISIDGIDQLDHDSEIAIEDVVAKGRIMGCNGSVVSLEDAIVVLSSEAFDSRCLASSPRVNRRIDEQNREEDGIEKGVKSRRFSMDLNACAEGEENNSFDNVGILNAVDGVFFFD